MEMHTNALEESQQEDALCETSFINPQKKKIYVSINIPIESSKEKLAEETKAQEMPWLDGLVYTKKISKVHFVFFSMMVFYLYVGIYNGMYFQIIRVIKKLVYNDPLYSRKYICQILEIGFGIYMGVINGYFLYTLQILADMSRAQSIFLLLYSASTWAATYFITETVSSLCTKGLSVSETDTFRCKLYFSDFLYYNIWLNTFGCIFLVFLSLVTFYVDLHYILNSKNKSRKYHFKRVCLVVSSVFFWCFIFLSFFWIDFLMHSQKNALLE